MLAPCLRHLSALLQPSGLTKFLASQMPSNKELESRIDQLVQKQRQTAQFVLNRIAINPKFQPQ